MARAVEALHTTLLFSRFKYIKKNSICGHKISKTKKAKYCYMLTRKQQSC